MQKQSAARDLLLDILSKKDDVHYGILTTNQRNDIISELFFEMDYSERMEYLGDTDAHQSVINEMAMYMVCHPDSDIYGMMSEFQQKIQPLFKNKINSLIEETNQYMIDSNYNSSQRDNFNED